MNTSFPRHCERSEAIQRKANSSRKGAKNKESREDRQRLRALFPSSRLCVKRTGLPRRMRGSQ
jgi:hypothetical protein